MKKFLYILIPVVVFDLLLDGEQLVKLPFLIQHFFEHHQREKVNFIGFLIQHYITRHAESKEHRKEHQNLPYKGHQDCAHIHIYYYDKAQIVSIVNYYTYYRKKIIYQNDNIKNIGLFSVWHPPRLV